PGEYRRELRCDIAWGHDAFLFPAIAYSPVTLNMDFGTVSAEKVSIFSGRGADLRTVVGGEGFGGFRRNPR
ncbi:MAG: hypothetical protein M3M98_03895, partial [Nitrospirota bacterium]|nr:hypothetical protein [Nitrospirota bacterium]